MDTSPDGGSAWTQLPSPDVVRTAAALLLAAIVAVLGAFILGEYQFEGMLPAGAGLLFGLIVGELVVEVGKRRTIPVAVAAAVLVAGGLLWAGWIASGKGLEPLRNGVWVAVAIGVTATALRVHGLRRPGATPPGR